MVRARPRAPLFPYTTLFRSAGMVLDLPGAGAESRGRLDISFEAGRAPDEWTRQLLEGAAHIAALLLEIERAHARRAVKPRRSEEHTSELQSQSKLVCRLLLE